MDELDKMLKEKKIIFDSIKHKRTEISELNVQLIKKCNLILELKTGFKCGQLVECNNVKGILTFGEYLDNWYWFKLKKDGTPSIKKSYIYCNDLVVMKAVE